MKLYCDITRQRFAQSLWLSAEPVIYLTQNDEPEIKIYLIVPSPGGGRNPFMYDVNAGAAGVTATATLCNPGGTPLTLTQRAELTASRKAFIGRLELDTEEIETFLEGRSERTAFLSIEITDGENSLTSFMGPVQLRAAATTAAATPIPGVIRATWVTGYTGGGITNLDGQETVGKPLGTRWEVTINGGQSNWELAEGSTPSNPETGFILTTDGGQLVRTLGY